MKHRRTRRFVRAFKRLPPEIQEQARKAFLLFSENPSHPGLSIERCGLNIFILGRGLRCLDDKSIPIA